MTRVKFAPMWLLGLCVAFSGLAFAESAAPPAPAAVVERFHTALLANMRAGKSGTFAERRQRLEPVIKETFDLPTMARLCTGAAWSKLSEDERSRVTAAFADWTIATYASRFKDWDGEVFATKDTTDDHKGNVMVDTRFTPKGEAPIVFTYRLHKVGDDWRIVDIYLEGAVSQMAMHRGEFAAALGNGGVEKFLLKHMQDLTARAEKEGA